MAKEKRGRRNGDTAQKEQEQENPTGYRVAYRFDLPADGGWVGILDGGMGEKAFEIFVGFVDPIAAGDGVGPEGLEVALLLVEKEGAMEAEGAGFWIIDETG